MKNLTSSYFTSIIMLIFLSTLFVACNLDKSGSSENPESASESAITSADIGAVDIAFCDKNVDNYHGCTCNFKEANGNESSIFMSNMNKSKSACISINGKTEILTGKRVDNRQDHLKHSYIPDWIVLDYDRDVHIFNDLVDDANYEENKKLIVETMLVMHDLPQEIKWRKITGPNGEEVPADLVSRYEQLWAESLRTATEEREKGNHGTPIEIELSNETFNAYVKGEVEKHNEDGSDNYKGIIEIKSKEGKLLGSKEFAGFCICTD